MDANVCAECGVELVFDDDEGDWFCPMGCSEPANTGDFDDDNWPLEVLAQEEEAAE